MHELFLSVPTSMRLHNNIIFNIAVTIFGFQIWKYEVNPRDRIQEVELLRVLSASLDFNIPNVM